MTDFLTQTFSGGKYKDFADWLHTVKNGRGGLEALGFITDIFADPANLILAGVAPFTGGASEAVAIGREAAKFAKVAENAGEGAKMVDSMKLLSDNKKFAQVFQQLKNGKTLSASVKDNPMVKALKQFGDTNGYTKKSRHAMQMA